MQSACVLLKSTLALILRQASAGISSHSAGLLAINFENGFHITLNNGSFTILASYKYNKCSDKQEKALKQAVLDANIIAYSGIKLVAQPGTAPRPIIDFHDQAAIDYFGPMSKNSDQRLKIFSEYSISISSK